MMKRPEGLIKMSKKALYSASIVALSYGFDKTLMNI